MGAKFKRLKEELNSLESDGLLSRSVVSRKGRRGIFQRGLSSPKWLKSILFVGFLGAFILYAGFSYIGTTQSLDNSFKTVENFIDHPNEDLLTSMGNWMEDMGYKNLSRQDLINLRKQGVTATFTSRMRDLGYANLTLDQLVTLRQNDVSSTFAAMMKELGYNLSVDDLIELRRHNVTAYYTSNLRDLGYTDLTKEDLIRLKDTGVRVSEAKKLIEKNGKRPSIDDLIRYHISNQ